MAMKIYVAVSVGKFTIRHLMMEISRCNIFLSLLVTKCRAQQVLCFFIRLFSDTEVIMYCIK
jgi:hypothetical protein